MQVLRNTGFKCVDVSNEYNIQLINKGKHDASYIIIEEFNI